MSDDRFPRCKVTGNLCGTDTRPAGEPCQCEPCQTHGTALLRPCRRYVDDTVTAAEIAQFARKYGPEETK